MVLFKEIMFKPIKKSYEHCLLLLSNIRTLQKDLLLLIFWHLWDHFIFTMVKKNVPQVGDICLSFPRVFLTNQPASEYLSCATGHSTGTHSDRNWSSQGEKKASFTSLKVLQGWLNRTLWRGGMLQIRSQVTLCYL